MSALVIVIVFLLVIIDQLIKIIMQNWLMGNGSYVVIEGLFQFTYVENRGAAFGMLQNMRWLFIILSIAGIIYLIYLVKTKKLVSKWLQAGAALIVAGGLGNLVDRIFRGYVIDFIEPIFINFAVFNLADILVNVGAAIVIVKLAIDLIVEAKQKRSVRIETEDK